MTRAEQAEKFRNLCRRYAVQKEWMRQEKRNSGIKEQVRGYGVSSSAGWRLQEIDERYRMMEHSTGQVERVLNDIGTLYGNDARTVVYDTYVKGMKQEEVAAFIGVHKRTLQRRMKEWIEGAIEHEEMQR